MCLYEVGSGTYLLVAGCVRATAMAVIPSEDLSIKQDMSYGMDAHAPCDCCVRALVTILSMYERC